MPAPTGDTVIDNPLPIRAVGRASRLAGAVHDGSAQDVAVILAALSQQELVELSVTLAAMVPVEYSPGDLLAWNDSRYDPVKPKPVPVVITRRKPRKRLQPHGTHAAFNRHKAREEAPCVACLQGERDFQRERGRRRRAKAA
jgi:hypothetical protein